MTFLRITILSLLACIATTGWVLSEERKVTTIRVIAHEYYDYYALPDKPKWKKVKSVKIEGENVAGSTQVYQTGPDTVLEAALFNIAVPSEYWVTVHWQGGERYYRSFISPPQAETVLNVYEPF